MSFVSSVELPDQGAGVVGYIHAVFFETVELLHGLVVQIFAVYHKYHFVYFWQVHYDLAGLEGGECFARSGGVPDVAVVAARCVLRSMIASTA